MAGKPWRLRRGDVAMRVNARKWILCQHALPEKFVQFTAPGARAANKLQRNGRPVFQVQQKVHVVKNGPPLEAVDVVQSNASREPPTPVPSRNLDMVFVEMCPAKPQRSAGELASRGE